MEASTLISEMSAAQESPRTAPTMGALARVRYTHLDMIDFLLANPGASQNELALRYGYSPSWVSNIMASDAWQAQFDKRRGEMVDPGLKHTIEEGFRAVVRRSQAVVLEMLDKPNPPPNVALKAMELGARSLGLGLPTSNPTVSVDLGALADRLVSLQSNVRKGTYNVQAEVVDAETSDGEGK